MLGKRWLQGVTVHVMRFRHRHLIVTARQRLVGTGNDGLFEFVEHGWDIYSPPADFKVARCFVRARVYLGTEMAW